MQHYSLSTKDTLALRGININPTCGFCNHPCKDIPHILFHCSSASSFWTKLVHAYRGNLTITSQLFSLFDWPSTWKYLFNTTFDNFIPWSTLSPYCLWHIWKRRNNNLFNHLHGRPIFRNAYSDVVEFFHLAYHNSPALSLSISLCWTPFPSPNSLQA